MNGSPATGSGTRDADPFHVYVRVLNKLWFSGYRPVLVDP